MARRTPLFELHQALGARTVDFGGWDMPVNYGSQIEEHHAVRQHAGLFDVSHMCVIDLHGTRVRPFLRQLLANDVAKLTRPGKALYSCMLNETGGVVDDLIVYFQTEQHFRLVVNAGTRDKDLAWIAARAAAFSVALTERKDLCMIAVQGPDARAQVAKLLSPPDAVGALALGAFSGAQFGDWFIARTGYTGEDGFEIMLSADAAIETWKVLTAAGARPCGLGARDTLRLEAGMNLYGQDMDEDHNPLEAGLAWTVVLEPTDRDFVGRTALEALRQRGLAFKQVGLVLGERAVMRAHQPVIVNHVSAGEITSGTFSPTLGKSIAFARVPVATCGEVQIDIRGKLLAALVVKLPFVRNGKILVS